MPIADLLKELSAIKASGLTRARRVLETPQGAHVVVDGCDCVAFCSNDYLGLANDPRIVAAAQAGAATYGVGASASHLILGHSRAHEALELELAQFVRQPRALLFSTGYMANLGVVTALVGRDDAIFADRLNHASLNDAALLSRAAFRRYPHNDVEALERLLETTKARRKLIITDAVFSMDGDIAPVGDLARLAKRHGAWLLLDDAHGFGVLGAEGRGVLSHAAVSSPNIIYMATLGKAAGVFGAFVAGEADLIEFLVQRARPYIYTTAMPPLLADALCASLAIIAAESWRRAALTRFATLLRERLAGCRWRLAASDTAIQPLVVGENASAIGLAQKLFEQGILVPAIRPPTVPQGTARLRISLSAAHSAEDVERLASALLSADAAR